MGIVLGPNQYGKAKCRVVRIVRDQPRHELRDVNVSTCLWGDFDAAHVAGDQSRVLPTDTQKNTCYAYAKQHGIDQIEEYALVLGRHFVDDVESVAGARVEVEEYAWDRVVVGGREHDYSWTRRGDAVRTAAVTVIGDAVWVVSGLHDLVLLKSTGSEFAGILKDQYTTLEETHDRVLATSLTARWRWDGTGHDWGAAYSGIRQVLVERFADVHSRALQQTLWEMGRAVLEAYEAVAEIRLSAPNKHHFVYDLARFGLDNPGEVFHADDRPYGLIQASAARDGGSDPGPAWETTTDFA
ncbi:MAG: factor-independent urate hydroxylase [Nocardioidaceae bacterium]